MGGNQLPFTAFYHRGMTMSIWYGSIFTLAQIEDIQLLQKCYEDTQVSALDFVPAGALLMLSEYVSKL